MKVGIFGGTFDPPHVGHLIIAETVREQFGLDRVLWIPSRQPPHKENPDIEPEDRLAMTLRTVADNEAFVVSELELKRTGPSYTIDTVQELQDTQPEREFVLIIGGDSLRTFHTWRAPDEILQRVPLVVYRRAPDDEQAAKERYARQARFADAPLLGLSSTDIRKRCRKGRSIRYLVPEAVRTYIAQHALYRTGQHPVSSPS